MQSAHYAALISADADWGQSSGLHQVLERLGFTPFSGKEQPAFAQTSQLTITQWTVETSEHRIATNHIAGDAGSVRLVVVPANIFASTRTTLSALFDGVLVAPVDELRLCESLAAQSYIALTREEPASFHTNLLELACDDRNTASQLLRLIIETNRSGLATLRANYDSALWEGVRSAAHQMAGSARILNCHGLISLLKRLEIASQERQRELITALMRVVVGTLESLESSLIESRSSIELPSSLASAPFLDYNRYRPNEPQLDAR